jgi:hypothetical protein
MPDRKYKIEFPFCLWGGPHFYPDSQAGLLIILLFFGKTLKFFVKNKKTSIFLDFSSFTWYFIYIGFGQNQAAFGTSPRSVN